MTALFLRLLSVYRDFCSRVMQAVGASAGAAAVAASEAPPTLANGGIAFAGGTYWGDRHDGVPHGHGVWRDVKGRKAFVGEWNAGKRVRGHETDHSTALRWDCEYDEREEVSQRMFQRPGHVMVLACPGTRADGTFLPAVPTEFSSLIQYFVSHNWDASSSFLDPLARKAHVLVQLENFRHFHDARDAATECVVVFSGHGNDRTGDWCVSDGTVSLNDIWQLWCRSPNFADRSKHLSLFIDACESGGFVDLAREQKLNITVQAAARGSSLDGAFTAAWLGYAKSRTKLAETKALADLVNVCVLAASHG